MMTEEFYKLGKYQINKCIQGMFNISEIDGGVLSFWFDEDTAFELMNLSIKGFEERAERMIKVTV